MGKSIVVAVVANIVGFAAFFGTYLLWLAPLHEAQPNSTFGHPPAAWAALFSEAAILLLALFAKGWRSTLYNSAAAFALACFSLATAEGTCRTGMLMFAACSVPAAQLFCFNVRGWVNDGGARAPYLLLVALMLPLIILGIVFME